MKKNNNKAKLAVCAVVFSLIFMAGEKLPFAMMSSSGLVSEAKAAGGASKEEVESKVQYLELDPLVLPVINERGLSQQISLIVSLEMVEGHQATEIQDYSPRLTDAFIRDLYGVLGSGYGLIRGNVLDVHLIKTRLSSVTETVIGPDLVEDVLLQVVQQRPL